MGIIRHASDALTLTGCRDVKSLRELDATQVAAELGWCCAPKVQVVQECAMSVKDSVLAAASLLKSCTHEGYVIVDSSFRRLQAKGANYVREAWLFHAKEMNEQQLLNVIYAGAAHEVCCYCPEYTECLSTLLQDSQQWWIT